MRIDWLHVDDYKNLQDFTIDLEEHEAMSVLIGENGSGKSNLFEAIVQIFRSLDLGEDPPFAYEIRYRCRGHSVTVKGAKDTSGNNRGYSFTIDGDPKVSWTAFKRRRDELLPEHVFAYYSGPGTRLEKLFQQHMLSFDTAVREEKVAIGKLRRLFYCLPRHSRFVLLSYFIDPTTDRNFLARFFGIEAFDSALVVLKQPWWRKKKPDPKTDPRFWGARGDVSRFLDAAWTQSLAPMRVTMTVEHGEAPGERRSEEEHHYLYLQDAKHLQALAGSWSSPKEFFAALDAVDLADLIGDVRVRVRCGKNTWMTFSELSEGEQQLLTVVGMLRFTQGDETLFLLDEPDTHLNPRWKLDYLDLLEHEVGGVKGSSQLILSTHDPLTIASLKRKQVQIFHRDEGTRRVHAREAPEDPRGMGVVGVLTQMFGLPRTLDAPTLKMMRDRDALMALDARTAEQDAEVRRLNDALAELGFMFESRDPKVDKVLRAVAEWERESKRLFWALSEAEQRALAQKLVQKMLGEPSPEGVL